MASSEDNISPHQPSDSPDLDTERIHRLISCIEQDLAGMSHDVPGFGQLKSDLNALKEALAESEKKHGAAAVRARSIRTSLQNITASMEGEVLKDSPYIAEIGRILGMV